MLKYRDRLLSVTTILLVAGAASAQITDEKAGTDFTNYYTGADLTTSTDWSLVGTPGLVQVEGTQLRYQPAAVSGGHFEWIQALPAVTGWTMELEFQITQPSADGETCFGVLASDGTAGEYNVLDFRHDTVKFRDAPQGDQLFEVDLTDGMHTIRIAEPAGGGTGDTSLWIDETLYAGDLTGLNYALTRCWIGEYTGSQASGEALINSVAIDTTGAYAPVGQVIPAPEPIENMAEAPSTDFDFKYEMDVDPTNPALIDLDSNGEPDFDMIIQGTAAQFFTAEGTWAVDSPADGDSCQLDGGLHYENAAWRVADMTGEAGCTLEFRIKVMGESTTGSGVFGMAMAPQDVSDSGIVNLDENQARWYNGPDLDETSNSDDFHVYRVVRDNFELAPTYWVWRDGVLMTEEPVGASVFAANRDAIYIGDISGGNGGGFELDYIRFTSGMYAPDGWVLPPDDIAGDLNGDGMVGSADLDIVRGNWGATVEAGCLSCGDPSGDGVVGSADLDIVRANWGATAAAAVPEPGTMLLIAFGFLAVVTRRR